MGSADPNACTAAPPAEGELGPDVKEARLRGAHWDQHLSDGGVGEGREDSVDFSCRVDADGAGCLEDGWRRQGRR